MIQKRPAAGPARRNLLLVLAYDGSGFKGWQRLSLGERTVQATLEAALETTLGEATNVVGSGRTDAGVHAAGQAANFWTVSALPLAELGVRLNATLPADLRCVGIREALPNFHARYRATGKTYAYRVVDRGLDDAMRRYSLRVKTCLDDAAMATACSVLADAISFAAFTNAKKDASHFVRDLREAGVERAGDYADIVFSADGFLYNQARLMAAAVLEVGLGRMKIERLRAIAESGDRRAAPGALGAFGLRLVSVDYREEDFLGPLLPIPGALPGGLPPGVRLPGARLPGAPRGG